MSLTKEATTEANRLIERAKEVLRQPVGIEEKRKAISDLAQQGVR